MAGTAGPMPLDAALREKVPTDRIDPLLMVHSTEQRFWHGLVRSDQPKRYKQSDIIGQRHFADIDEVAGHDRAH
jgi:hypothetical protein